MKTKYLLPVYMLCLCISSTIEAQQWKKELHAFLNNSQRDLRAGAPVDVPSKDTRQALDVIQTYLRDSIFEVRLKSLELAHHLSTGSNDSLIRQDGVQLLVSSLHDVEVAGQALSMLTTFRRKDFSDSSRAVIMQHIEAKHTYLNELMRIAGYLRLVNLKPVMMKYSAPGNPASRRWAALISLARMGEETATSEIMTRVQRLPLNDDVVYNVFPDLIFTRQPIPVGYIVQAMHNEEKNCFSADAEREIPIPCTYRIAEQLADIIDGFPLSLDASGDLQTTDYAEAAEVIKTWFLTNPQYKIRDDSY